MPIHNKPKSKKVTEIDPKYIERSEDPNVMISEDPATIQFLLARAENQKRAEQEAKLEAKRREQELKRMADMRSSKRSIASESGSSTRLCLNDSLTCFFLEGIIL